MNCQKVLCAVFFCFGVCLQGTGTVQTILDCSDITHSEGLDQTITKYATYASGYGSFNTANRFIFDYFPGLKSVLSWVELAQFPTPLKKMEKLSAVLGHSRLYIKDDGQTDAQIGGNKIRKLEPILADALYQGATAVCTFGCVGSNLVTEACFCAKKMGLNCAVHLKPEPNSKFVQNNLLLDYLLGADFYYYPNHEFRKIGALNQIMQHRLEHGNFEYVIPTGASSPLGAVGYVNAAFELKEQIKAGLMPEPDYIYIAVGSVGTIAGLALGLAVAEIDCKIIGVGSFEADFTNCFLNLVIKANLLLHEHDATFPLINAEKIPVTFDCNYVGQGYAYFTPEGQQAIELFKTHENILLDPVYSGKCAAAFIEQVTTKPELQNKVVLFWNTFGICQKVEDDQLYKALPKPLHQFFKTPVQEG